MSFIYVDSISKTFAPRSQKKRVDALKNFSLEVPEGIIFGLLGQNGAGKTTLIKILLGITHPSSGSFRIGNWDITNYRYKQHIGYLPENHKFPSVFTARYLLTFFGKLYGLDGAALQKRIDELLALVQLTQWANAKVRTYSKGMMQRLGIAQVLINNPAILFLDEPTDGVDPIGRKEIRNVLLSLKETRVTVFLNSHILSEVEMVTDRVAILNKGELLTEGNVKELTRKGEEYKITTTADLLETLDETSVSRFFIRRIQGNSFTFKIAFEADIDAFIDLLRSKEISIRELAPSRQSLEDLFIAMVQDANSGKEK